MMTATIVDKQSSLDYKNLKARLWEFKDIMGKKPETEAEEGE